VGKIKNHQAGFSTVEVVLVLVVVVVIGVVGFMVYKNQNSKTDNKQSVTETSGTTQKPAGKKTQSTSSKVSVITKESIQDINPAAPGCGSQAAISQAEPSFDLKYTKPENWVILDTYPNGGASYKSADFKSEQGFRNISTGASLSLSVQSFCKDGNGLAKDIESYAQNQTMQPGTQLTYIKVAGYYGAKFTHNTGENHNNHAVVLLFKDDRMYTIEEQFNYSAANPYPNIIDQTLNTIE